MLRRFRGILSNSLIPLLQGKRMPREKPVVFVIGCTGTGKSDLGIAFAKEFNGEVISADSMQLYEGLDIATNKVTDEERQGVPHHLMSFLHPSVSNFNIHDFKERSLGIIQRLHEEGKLPVIVGGTTYYVESLLFKGNLIEGSLDQELNAELEATSVDTLYARLKSIDPASAALIHPNNKKRVRRALEIALATGKPKSEHLKEQRERSGHDMPGHLRFENSLVVYLDAPIDVLDRRLDSRVAKMVSRGLCEEIEEFHRQFSDIMQQTGFGVMQCIGLKEFVPYLALNEEERNGPLGTKLFEQGCEDVKEHTRQYSRNQRKWVTNHLTRRRANTRTQVVLRRFDTSNFDAVVVESLPWLRLWLQGYTVESEEVTESPTRTTDALNRLFVCETCGMTIQGAAGWEAHERGKRHRKRKAAVRRREQDAAS